MTSKEAKIVTFEPLDGFQHLRGLFGVLLEDQFNADIILGRVLYISSKRVTEGQTQNFFPTLKNLQIFVDPLGSSIQVGHQFGTKIS